uniref:Uncharacterized protein n=1 Tax=Eutreptiella gymnastica TaxID=73025 RepID=A0A7S1IUQ8_9EUGL
MGLFGTRFTLKVESRRLSWWSVSFLAAVTVETIFIISIYLIQLRQGLLLDSFTHFNGVILMATALFQWYFAGDAVYSESGMQLLMFLAVSGIMALRSMDIYYEAMRSSEEVQMMLTVACFGVLGSTIAHIPLCYYVHGSFGYLIYYNVSANYNEVVRYKNYQRYVALMKLDLQFSVTGAIALAFYFEYNSLEYVASFCLVLMTVLLSIVSVPMVQQENARYCKAFFGFSFALPVYGLRKIIMLWCYPDLLNWATSTNSSESRTQTLRIYMTVTGVLEMVGRIFMLYFLAAVISDFGEGTLSKVFEKNTRRRARTMEEQSLLNNNPYNRL